MIYLVMLALIAGLLDSYFLYVPVLSFFSLILYYLYFSKGKKETRIIFNCALIVLIASAAWSSVYFYSRENFESGLKELMSDINSYHDINGDFPDKLMEISAKYRDNSRNVIKFWGAFLIRYKYCCDSARWPILDIREGAEIYSIDSKDGEVMPNSRKSLID